MKEVKSRLYNFFATFGIYQLIAAIWIILERAFKEDVKFSMPDTIMAFVLASLIIQELRE